MFEPSPDLVELESGLGGEAALQLSSPPPLVLVPGGHTSSGPISRTPGWYEHFGKRLFDLVGSVLLLLLTLPLLLVLFAVVRVNLGRGVLFRQSRVGRYGQPFTVFKVRTMHQDRRRVSVPVQRPERRLTHKHPADPRLTPLGKFLRKWSLDELPQLWNVMKGDMSLVGPRPELQSIVADYEPWQHTRHDVKPGLTGLWQIRARGDGSLMKEHTNLDVEYAERVGFIADLLILLLTIPALMGRRPGH